MGPSLPSGPRWGPTALRLAALVLVALAIGVTLRLPESSAPTVRSDRPVWAFMPPWNPGAMASLRAHAGQVSTVLPLALHLTPHGDLVRGRVDPALIELRRHDGPRIVPVLWNYDGGWRPAVADRILRDPRSSRRLVATLAAMARRDGWDGVDLDLERLPARDRPHLVALVRRLAAALGPGREVSVTVALGAGRAYDLAALGRAARHVVLMARDQHARPGRPGPVAAPGWVRAGLRRARRAVPPGRLVVGLPTYANRWSAAGGPFPLDVAAAWEIVRQAGAIPRWSRSAAAPHVTIGAGRGRQTLWLADAVAFANDLRALPGRRPVALWYLGGEDPGVWTVLARRPGRIIGPARALRTIPAAPEVLTRGRGEVVRAGGPAPGRRAVARGLRSERYLALPRPWRLERRSGGAHRVALTFSGGPSAAWTPRILDMLGRLGVPATFFVVGESAAEHPDLVRREVAEGYTVGNQTFSHADLSTSGAWRGRLELIAADRVITGITGRRPLLFSPPATTAPGPEGSLGPMLLAQGLGDIPVEPSLDTGDYRRPGVGRIVQNALSQLGTGGVIRMTDGGWDRSQTLAALPILVGELRERGYRLVPLPDLLGLTRDQVMPPAHGVQLWLGRATAWAVEGWLVLVKWVTVLGLGVLALLALRALAYGVLATRHRRRGDKPPSGRAPSVTIIVPAYNEAPVIGRTLDSLMAQAGVDLEVMVVDDGSTDATASIAEARGVRVIRQANGGKWSALNQGLLAARGEVVVAIDADTQLERHAVARLVQWFADPRVGAVSGTVKVGNRHTLLTLWQHVEYVTAFNLDRRAYSDMNAITVVPGAIGAWRRSALESLGGYSGRTLAEDCDLTVALRRNGWRIPYEPTAVAWTEAPETLRGLARQRLRWTFGTLQVLWLNRDAVFRPREGALGMVALPYAWLYQVVLTILAPAVDLIVLLALLAGQWHTALWWFVAATAAEMLVSWAAFRMEGERAWPVLVLPLQRAVYRQLMYMTVLRALGRALRGRRLGWGTLARTGSVKVRPAPPSEPG